MNLFHMKTRPGDTVDRFQEFIEEKFVAIGWSELGDLAKTSKEELRDLIATEYQLSGHALGNYLGQVNCFVNTMNEGDVVIIAHRDTAYIGIVGTYYYDANYIKDDMCHRRKVEWTARVSTKDLEHSVQRLLNSRNVISQFHDTFESSGLDKYIHGELRLDKKDQSKLEELVSDALAVLEAELKSSNPDRRLKAATELLRLRSSKQ